MTWTVLGGGHPCPICNAQPGNPCTSRNGIPSTTSHAARYRDLRTGTCHHCGQGVIQGLSPTGWVHDTNRRARCDGRLSRAPGRTSTTLARIEGAA